MELILASTSPYRQSLLKRLQIPFRCESPDVDEAKLPDESSEALALRLAIAKANAVADRNPDAWVIGSDQVASIDGMAVGKPGNHQAAAAQLRASSGKSITFYTGLALISNGQTQSLVETYIVHFRALRDADINAYLRKEQPYDCAGSFKCEGLGVALFERLQGNDPTALEGLPLIATCQLLRAAGFELLS